MDERRQVHRRKPIVLITEENGEFIAKPLEWQKRNDLGEEVLQQNVAITNEAVKLFKDEAGSILVDAKLQEPLSDPFKILGMAYPDKKPEDFEGLSFDEIFELIHVALDVNHLERLWRLLDPNSNPPEENGGTNSSAGEMTELVPTGPKTESTEDFSSSSEETVTPLSASPTEKSST